MYLCLLTALVKVKLTFASTFCDQVYAEHYRRALWTGGGLLVWPRGNAFGGPQEPPALPRRLCVVRLGSLESMSTGKDGMMMAWLFFFL